MKRPASSSSLPIHTTVPSRLNSNSNGEIIRGGAQAVEEAYDYYQDGDADEYEADGDDDDEGYYLVGENDDDAVADEAYYEYYPNDNYEDEGVMEDEDGYYYSDELYGDEEEEAEGDGFFHLQDVDEDGDESSKRSKFLPSGNQLNLSGATLSTAIPKALSQLSTLPSTLKDMNWQSIISGGGGPATAVAVLSIVMLTVVRRTFVLGGSHNKKNGKGNGKGQSLPTERGGKEKVPKDVSADSKEGAVKDAEYSNAFVDAVREMEKEDDDDTLDLDSDEYDNSDRVGKRFRIVKRLRKVSSSTTLLATNALLWIRGHAGEGSRGGNNGPSSDALTESTVVDVDDVSMDGIVDETNTDLSASESDKEVEDDVPTLPTPPSLSSIDVKWLKQKLEKMSESRDSLEKEYEASLRMLHDARMEVQKMKIDVQTAMDNSAREEEQRKKMDTMINKLDMKYKNQMKEQLEQLRNKMESKLRSKVQLEMQERMESQLQERMEEQDEQLEEKVQQRLGVERSKYQEELNRKFKQEVDDAVSAEIGSVLDVAVNEAVQRERQKAREEMVRVRQGIQKVLERERKLMREQVRRATGQVREWVVKQQQDQLLQQAGQLQEEAQKLQGLARSRAGGRGGRDNATNSSVGSSRRGSRPTSREEYADRYEDTDGENY
eukprot:CAMPEP_0201738758 /NCGR_PEP_ID=MMETSP0593-20130828/45421_1 /ASSEMBLY_ACC=CAM_ASM_000672 /TAXON_ID=267983 /ORGANISM="Skeletonema japonicum, Strain CCMP2506" /LENGTH=661 /DNA_ID=CAMNT_0048232985 /DNA_START=125 /DNA_END=2110 /DNA_ORIENTATION=-